MAAGKGDHADSRPRDWNWPLLGAPWLDLVTLLLAVAGDGLDADAVVATHPLTCDVEPRSIDAWLATLWLYFTTSMELPVPAHSPHLWESANASRSAGSKRMNFPNR
jgi:hypothetical protein